jgi:hypothetical protein
MSWENIGSIKHGPATLKARRIDEDVSLVFKIDSRRAKILRVAKDRLVFQVGYSSREKYKAESCLS